MRPADGSDEAVQNATDASSPDRVLGNEYLPLGVGGHFLDDFTGEDGDDTNIQSAVSPPPRQDNAIASTSGNQEKFHAIIDGLDSILKNRSRVYEPSGPLFGYAEDPLLADIFTGQDPSIAMSEDLAYTTGQRREVVLLLVSSYVQMIELFETIFVHIHRRLKHLDADPIPSSDPAKGLRIGAFYSFDGRLESIIYTQVVACLLERGLGLLPDQQRMPG
ncbi:hypothetical protein DL767_000524 [Monosporascus sp. MG133]|nr:hypothetical protein DL767_000524 [Monosporascus sp. MG133]